MPFWCEQGLCSNSGGNLTRFFFSERIEEIARAKAICSDCPVLGECLQAALDRKEPCGVWGGQLFSEGKILTAKRNRGRPAKNPTTSEAIWANVPIPEYLREQVEQAQIAQPVKQAA